MCRGRRMMRNGGVPMAKAELSSLAAAWLAAGLSGSVLAAEVRAKAEVACRPAENKLQYDCTIRLTNARSNEPLAGLTLSVGADMPSMPGAHNVRPVKATEGQEGGTYQARIALEMYGDW